MTDPISASDAQAALTPNTQSVVIKATQAGSEAPTPTPKADPNRPAWLPQKFKNEEELAKAYGELEKKLSGGKAPETPPAKSEEQQKPLPTDLSIKAAEKAVEDAGLNFDEFTQEVATKGTLSPESYAKLEAKGYPKNIVDIHIQGIQALQERSVNEVLKDVGGREGYDKIAQWASVNVPKDQLEAYNRAVSGTDIAVAKLALQGLQAQYAKSVEPNFLRQGESVRGKGDVFRSTAEMVEAMRDPRYAKDPAYRNDIAEKLRRSDIM